MKKIVSLLIFSNTLLIGNDAVTEIARRALPVASYLMVHAGVSGMRYYASHVGVPKLKKYLYNHLAPKELLEDGTQALSAMKKIVHFPALPGLTPPDNASTTYQETITSQKASPVSTREHNYQKRIQDIITNLDSLLTRMPHTQWSPPPHETDEAVKKAYALDNILLAALKDNGSSEEINTWINRQRDNKIPQEVIEKSLEAYVNTVREHVQYRCADHKLKNLKSKIDTIDHVINNIELVLIGTALISHGVYTHITDQSITQATWDALERLYCLQCEGVVAEKLTHLKQPMIISQEVIQYFRQEKAFKENVFFTMPYKLMLHSLISLRKIILGFLLQKTLREASVIIEFLGSSGVNDINNPQQLLNQSTIIGISKSLAKPFDYSGTRIMSMLDSKAIRAELFGNLLPSLDPRTVMSAIATPPVVDLNTLQHITR